MGPAEGESRVRVLFPDLFDQPSHQDGSSAPFRPRHLNLLLKDLRSTALASCDGVTDEIYWREQVPLAADARLNAAKFASGEYIANSIGGHANRFVKDARVMRVTDKYDLVYWGGELAESNCVWSLHVSKAPPGETRPAGRTRPFDADIHRPVNLKKEKIRVLVQGMGRKKYVTLDDQKMIASEGALVYLEETGPRNRKTLTPIILPRRERRMLPAGTVVLPA